MKEIKERLTKAYDYLYSNGAIHSQREFADKLQYNPATVSQAMNGYERSLTKGFIRRVCDTFPNINYDWLLTGRGDMLAGDIVAPVSLPYAALPVLSLNAISDDINIMSAEKMLLPVFSEAGAQYIVRVLDSSMSPRYQSGDLLACRKVEPSFFQSGRVYVIGTYSQGGMIKRVEVDADENYIICKCENSDYGDFKLPKSEISTVGIVLGLVRVE